MIINDSRNKSREHFKSRSRQHEWFFVLLKEMSVTHRDENNQTTKSFPKIITCRHITENAKLVFLSKIHHPKNKTISSWKVFARYFFPAIYTPVIFFVDYKRVMLSLYNLNCVDSADKVSMEWVHKSIEEL